MAGFGADRRNRTRNPDPQAPRNLEEAVRTTTARRRLDARPEHVLADLDQWAETCHRSVVRPRLDALQQHIPGTSIEHIGTAHGFSFALYVRQFKSHPRTGDAASGIDLEPQRAMIVVSYSCLARFLGITGTIPHRAVPPDR